MSNHQTENPVLKWPKKDYPQIVVVGVSEEKLAEIKIAITARLGADVARGISFFQQDDFLTALGPPLASPPPPKVVYINGRKSTATYVVLSPAETKAREQGLIKLMAQMCLQESGSKPSR